MKLTWFGHSAFRVEFGDTVILIDPFLTGNPKFQGDVGAASAGCTHVLITHGHDDHVGDAVDICRNTGAQVIGSAETCGYFGVNGIENVNPGNHGGTVDCGGFTVSFVNALHSSSKSDGKGGWVYIGNPLGLIVKASGEPTLYHMGDTGLFGDMALIQELHEPEIGIVPIGDRFTMGAKEAAIACTRFFRFRAIIPCHFGTFPIIDQTPDAFIAELGAASAAVTVADINVPFDL